MAALEDLASRQTCRKVCETYFRGKNGLKNDDKFKVNNVESSVPKIGS